MSLDLPCLYLPCFLKAARGARVAVWRVTHAWPSLFVICYAYAGEAPDPGPVCRVRCVCVP